ncbi:alpha-mannosidase [Streptomyces sp. AK02-01A]|uniref:alpha-mannosidase n=1 Tax=Streptomyces sp. AK02-01A TaxID=3028648 RepID=UPI0029AE197F|nr:glycoside hydrolase family 38 C-terminal domain-containing protein [Streptomyces sp. AK02-01A]MDX3853841.1 glycoside hydrolase family 38 C-terminal domain-containing protein [Streptomyces sp. AK02-01A]
MHDRRKSGEARTAHFLAGRLRPALYTERLPLDVGAWHIPGEPVPVEVALRAGYTPFAVGDTWGGPWSTTWFQVRATVPERWAGRRVEAVFDLGFDQDADREYGSGGSAEGLVHDAQGTPLQGLYRHHRSLTVSAAASGGEQVRLLIEAAANPSIDAGSGAGTHYGDPVTVGDEPLYRLLRADLAVRDEDIWQLIHDIDVLNGLTHALPEELPRRYEILRALERAVDAVDPRDVPGTAAHAREILAPVLARRAHESAHTVAAVGHARPDSAWLWPMRETVRKGARVFSTMTTLAEEYPELTFAASSAQQYAWMKDHHPHVFERVRKAVADGNWAPVGGMWVEPDGNLPGGEALVRQFVYGRRFFREELGTDTDGVWLPESSGVSAAFPQLAVLAGARWFLGRKLAKDDTGAMPHHTFWWEGLDGTRIFSHFPPAGTHSPALTGGELADSVAAYADKGGGTRSLMPFGHADGGPSREMLERARRLADLEGAPRVHLQHPARFFRDALDEYPDAPVWRGELHLANHHGTYTSQARTKRGNRRGESLLREAELWSATAAVRDNIPYPYDELETLWKKVLLHQCQDILPGASIAWVHQEAEQTYREIHRRLDRLIRRAVGAPGGGSAAGVSVFNAGPYPRREVVVLDADGPVDGGQRLSDGRTAVLAEAPALGRGPAGPVPSGVAPVTVRPVDGGGQLLDNGLLRIRIDADGLVRSVLDLATGRDAIAPGAAGNLLQLHRDDPARWSARNLDAQYRATCRDLDRAGDIEVTESGPLLASVRVVRSTGRSTIEQELSLTAGSRVLAIGTEVDWREQDTILKAAWPLDVHAEHSSGEIQFGHVERPTHENTGWDAARFEIWAHRWIHVGEHGWGVALAGDSTYGYDVSRHTREDAGTTTTVRLSLLRSAHSPDPHADRGPQHFRHTVRPGAEVGDAIAEGYALNLPLRPGPAGPAAPALVSVGHPDVVVEAVKLADDRSGDVVVRLYESRGGRARTALTAAFPVTAVYETDLLEETLAVRPCENGSVALTLRPFQILTLRLVRGARGAADRSAGGTGA